MGTFWLWRGAGQQSSFGGCTAFPDRTRASESKKISMILKALNDLISEIRTVKKILNISEGTKAIDAVNPRRKLGWRASEIIEKTKSRFAGAMVKGTKVPKQFTSSIPQLLTLKVITIEQSDLNSEQYVF